MSQEPEALMQLALAEARLALEHGDVPVAALVVDQNGEILAKRHNERELHRDPTAHAEVLAIRDAAQKLGTWRLNDCTLVVTLEPCVMCAGVIQQARVGSVIFGAMDMKAGAVGSLYNVGEDPRFPHTFDVTMRVLETECSTMLSDFFATLR